MEDNKRRGTTCEYLLVSCQNDDRMHSCSIDMALDRANNDVGLAQRSLHKVRKTVLSRLDMSRNYTVERIREIAGHSRESITLYTNYFYTIEGLDGISECKTFEEVVEYKMPDFGKLASVFLEPKSDIIFCAFSIFVFIADISLPLATVPLLKYSFSYKRHFFRTEAHSEYVINESNGCYYIEIGGHCIGSVYSCMCEGSGTYYEDYHNSCPTATSLKKESEQLHLAIEVFSKEPGSGIAEHIIYNNGVNICFEETNYMEFYTYDFDSPEDFYESTGLAISQEQLDSEVFIEFGGFDEIFII